MRIPSEDGGYLEFQRSKKAYHVHVIVAARSPDNPLKLVINTSEVKLNQLLDGVRAVCGPIMLEGDNGQNNTAKEKSAEATSSKISASDKQESKAR